MISFRLVSKSLSNWLLLAGCRESSLGVAPSRCRQPNHNCARHRVKVTEPEIPRNNKAPGAPSETNKSFVSLQTGPTSMVSLSAPEPKRQRLRIDAKTTLGPKSRLETPLVVLDLAELASPIFTCPKHRQLAYDMAAAVPDRRWQYQLYDYCLAG